MTHSYNMIRLYMYLNAFTVGAPRKFWGRLFHNLAPQTESDRTEAETGVYRNLVAELDRRTRLGETNLGI